VNKWLRMLVWVTAKRYYLQKRNPIFKLDRILIDALIRSYSGQGGHKRLLDYNRVYLFRNAAIQIDEDNVLGAMAEVGVYQGRTATLLRALLPHRTLCLFDTFQGFPEQDIKGDPVEAVGVPRSILVNLFRRTDLNSVKARIGFDGDTRYIVGRFPDSLHYHDLPDQYCLVHLDCDLRESTLAALNYFYPRLSPGGFLIIHDYAHPHWPGVRSAVDDFLSARPERPIIGLDAEGSACLRRNF